MNTLDVSKIKVIAMDLDGTLTQHKQHMTPENRAALEALAKKYKLVMAGAGQVMRIFNQLEQFPIDIIGNYGLQFGTPHCPVKPATLRAVNSNGETVPLRALIPHQLKHAWIDHFETKTAEEYMQKARRGFPLSQQYGEEFLRNAVRFFFCINERTPEKEEILKDILYNLKFLTS